MRMGDAGPSACFSLPQGPAVAPPSRQRQGYLGAGGLRGRGDEEQWGWILECEFIISFLPPPPPTVPNTVEK